MLSPAAVVTASEAAAPALTVIARFPDGLDVFPLPSVATRVANSALYNVTGTVATPAVKVIEAGEPKSTAVLFLSVTVGDRPVGDAFAPVKVNNWSPV